MQKRKVLAAAGLTLTVVVMACASEGMNETVNADYTAAGMAPQFQVDPFWPKPLPNHWIMGATIGVDVDSRGHIWIV
ncbi:MAG: hypothetical protein OEN56_08180, partial [Gemmatimonadota bacterium]|nr:hypothetical protein [Gemmatimonadota bacterium]